ncbi:MAG: hypothetical protein ACI910_000003 [Oleispira sp.]|jgi:hypothetical protein
MKRINNTLLTKLPLAIALVAVAGGVQATEFTFGDLRARWDNTISYGVAMRTEAPDTNIIDGYNAALIGLEGNASSGNFDDGTLNFKKNSIYTNVFKYGSDLEINYKQYGGFFRVRGFYDTALMDNETEFKELNEATKNAAGLGYDLLDAYVWADYDLGNMPGTFRVGRQVISWGESTFIQNGLNVINPVDAAAFRRPGAEVKDLLMPVNMIYTSIGITPDISVDAFYQLEWEKTRIDPCGTFFSNVDFAADGCGPVILGGTADEFSTLAFRDSEIAAGDSIEDRTAPVTERLSDVEPKDDGQYGVSARFYAEETEYGIYFMNVHSRLPFISGAVTNQDRGGYLGNGDDRSVNDDAFYKGYYPLYQVSYPEDQMIMGMSFATTSESGVAISGEFSYRPDAPLQWNSFELLLGGLGLPWSRLYQQRKAEAEKAGLGAEDLYGELAKGYDEFDVWQAQMTFIQFYDRVLGGDRFIVAAEIGATFIPDLPSLDDARFGRSGAFGVGNNAGIDPDAPSPEFDYCISGGTVANIDASRCNDEGYVSQLSGGIRFRSGINYNNAFAGFNTTPYVGMGYDIGNGPEPGSQFIDERLTVAVGIRVTYQNRAQATFTYTDYSGGDYNDRKDRDNIALAASFSF